MTILMTLKRALERKLPNDMLQYKNKIPVTVNEHGFLICIATKMIFELKTYHVTDAKWQIIPEEPKVQTAEEWISTQPIYYKNPTEKISIHRARFEGFKAGEENMKIRYKSLIELIDVCKDLSPDEYYNIRQALENINK